MYSEAYSKPSQTSNLQLFAKISYGWKLSIIFAESSILDIWPGSECASGIHVTNLDFSYGNIERFCEFKLRLQQTANRTFHHSYYPFCCVSPLHLKFYIFLFVCISILACNGVFLSVTWQPIFRTQTESYLLPNDNEVAAIAL